MTSTLAKHSLCPCPRVEVFAIALPMGTTYQLKAPG